MTENPFTPEIAPELLLEADRLAALALVRTRYETAAGELERAARAYQVTLADRPAALELLTAALAAYQSVTAELIDAIENLVDR